MIDPYVLLGVERDADEAAIKSAYRKVAKAAHPDSGGDAEQFARLQTAYELLKDPVRRKVFDDTGYDPQLADAKDLKGLLMLETLVNEFILDEREPGSFDPVAAMRRKLTDDILKSRFPYSRTGTAPHPGSQTYGPSWPQAGNRCAEFHAARPQPVHR